MAENNKVTQIIERRQKKKKRQQYVKDILKVLLLGGAIYFAASSPRFTTQLMKIYFKNREYKRENFLSTFEYLKKRGLIEVTKRNKQLFVSLTKEGKNKAGRYRINDLKIQRSGPWDGLWRLAIFDIPQDQRYRRELFRGKIKELGFFQLQKSVWAHPFECGKEISLLKSFFGLSDKNIRVITAISIGEDSAIKKHFKL